MESVAGPGPPEALMGWSRFVSQENPAPESGGRGGGGGGEHLSGLRTPLACAACGPAYLPQPDARVGVGRPGDKDIGFQQLLWPFRCQQNFDQENIGVAFCSGKM